jgi:hypothetical protein
MTDRKDALITLLEKVEAGEVVNSRDASRIWPTGYAHAINAGHGDLNAAKALHEAVLPGNWGFKLVEDKCDVFNRDAAPVFGGYCHENPARAWLIAILKALIAQDTTQDGEP